MYKKISEKLQIDMWR